MFERWLVAADVQTSYRQAANEGHDVLLFQVVQGIADFVVGGGAYLACVLMPDG